MPTPFDDPNVVRVFNGFPDDQRAGLLRIRGLIYDVASRTEGVGPIHETLKWGQPAYRTPTTKSGATIRLGLPKTGGFAV